MSYLVIFDKENTIPVNIGENRESLNKVYNYSHIGSKTLEIKDGFRGGSR